MKCFGGPLISFLTSPLPVILTEMLGDTSDQKSECQQPVNPRLTTEVTDGYFSQDHAGLAGEPDTRLSVPSRRLALATGSVLSQKPNLGDKTMLGPVGPIGSSASLTATKPRRSDPGLAATWQLSPRDGLKRVEVEARVLAWQSMKDSR